MNPAHQQGRCTGRCGLTMVELLAATVLAVLLVAAVLSALRTVTQQQAVTSGESAASSWHTQLQGQLQWDLTNSRSIRPIKNGFELEGFAGRTFAGRDPLHCRAIVRYVLVREADRSCLLRTEIHPDSQRRDNRLVGLVCLDVDSITLNSSGDDRAKESTSEQGFRIRVPKGDLPATLRVALSDSDSMEPVFDHEFAIR